MEDVFEAIGAILECIANILTSAFFWVWFLGVVMGFVTMYFVTNL